jgi:hypothetical protein
VLISETSFCWAKKPGGHKGDQVRMIFDDDAIGCLSEKG